MIRSLSFILLFLISACSSSSTNTYTVAMSPSFNSVEVLGREKNIEAFLTDLFSEVSNRAKIRIPLESVNSNTLFDGLQKMQYQAVVSGMPPYNFTESTYSFSSVFLQTGPVLIVPTGSSVKSLEKLSSKEVGIISDSMAVSILEKYPGIIIRPYDSIPGMLNDLSEGILEAALVAVLPAEGYCNDLYKTTLKIVTPPLNDAGLRIITMKGSSEGLLQAFDKSLKKMQEDGSFAKLMQKWGLSS
ncbi:MAG: transporter substrate-binding domain-containing protein [Chlamydiae bacterium]|nr:transporter substrate-binding domain-containing protein [Chlamydiota bacterium]